MLLKKTTLILSVTMIGIACICLVIACLYSYGSSKKSIFFENPDVYIGRVPVGIPQSVKFRFMNNEDEPIKILKVRKSCSCGSDIIFPDEPIFPGQGGEIVIGKYTPGAGLKKATFALKMADGKDNLFSITSRGYIDAFLSTRELRFPLISRQQGREESITLIGNRDIKVSHDSVSVKPLRIDWLTVQVQKPERREVIQKNGDYQVSNDLQRPITLATIRVKINPGAPVGEFSEMVLIQIEDQKGKIREMSFKCLGEIKEEVYAMPQRLIILNKDDGVYEGEITLRSLHDPFTITSVNSKNLECDFNPNQVNAHQAFVKVKIPENTQFNEGKVCIKIDHPRISDILIPVKVISL